jgi:hypothetical protein
MMIQAKAAVADQNGSFTIERCIRHKRVKCGWHSKHPAFVIPTMILSTEAITIC